MKMASSGRPSGYSGTIAGALTCRVKVVVCVCPPPEPVTVIVYAPTGVEGEVVTVNTLAPVGVTLETPKPPEAPDGKPLADNETGTAVPPVSVNVIVLEPEPPATTVTPPLFEIEKSNVTPGPPGSTRTPFAKPSASSGPPSVKVNVITVRVESSEA
jgi:hypothetical protein